jgi:hypothetical protein
VECLSWNCANCGEKVRKLEESRGDGRVGCRGGKGRIIGVIGPASPSPQRLRPSRELYCHIEAPILLPSFSQKRCAERRNSPLRRPRSGLRIGCGYWLCSSFHSDHARHDSEEHEEKDEQADEADHSDPEQPFRFQYHFLGLRERGPLTTLEKPTAKSGLRRESLKWIE